ncbi:MAG: rRNA pseudouridine synthase [Ignavibacteriae bacterium HGW-Ignavibacteriae-3]|nr:MAG: rRNA pseudouridine synthase [Ignavibacteriae bacterium HGW-Ignavibacteriae-3]
MKTRLNRYLSECGLASRRKAEEFIREARISVNGSIVIDLACTVDPDKDIIQFDGERIKPEKKVYFLLNKPKGYITSTDDEKGRKTVLDLIETRIKIFPVGRLDYDTTGVLLLTNDGDFTNFLTHPSHKIPREYKVSLHKPLDEEDRLKLIKGIILDRKKSRFIDISFTGKGERNKVMVTAVEGRNHFVKNMFSALGYFVDRLERTNYGGLDVKGIPVGSYRILSRQEIKKVYETYGK